MSHQTQNSDTETRIVQIARQLLDTGSSGDQLLRRVGSITQALAVLAPDGEIHSWFVTGRETVAFKRVVQDETRRESVYCKIFHKAGISYYRHFPYSQKYIK